MRCQSIHSLRTDGYRAGCDIGEGLRALRPEVVLLFASITYEGAFADLFAGLEDALDRRDVIVFGGTSDGIYETAGVSHHGVCGLGLSADGAVRWTVAVEQGVGADSFGAAHRCAQRARADLGGDVDFAFAFADGVKADGSAIAAGLSAVLDQPFLGGLAGDDRKFLRSWIFCRGKTHADAVGLLAARGPVRFIVNSASGWSPIGQAGIVEHSLGSTVLQISGMTPPAFLREQIGKVPGETDLGIVPLATYAADGSGHYFLRTPSRFDPVTGAATMFGSIREGASVRVCTASRDDVLRAVDDAMQATRSWPHAPAGALLVSCAGRKWLLDEGTSEEVERVLAHIGHRLPLVGLPSFGEIGPFLAPDGRSTPTYFHNVTFVVCLFGA